MLSFMNVSPDQASIGTPKRNGAESFLSIGRCQPLPNLLILISFGIVGFSQADIPKEVDGWSKAKWEMTAEQLIQAFKSEGAVSSKRMGLECDSAVEIPTFKFETQDKQSAVTKVDFRVRFQIDKSSNHLCGIEIDPIRPNFSVRFNDVESMLIGTYGKPKSVETDKLMPWIPIAMWSFPSTSIRLSEDRISFSPEATKESTKLSNPPAIQSKTERAISTPGSSGPAGGIKKVMDGLLTSIRGWLPQKQSNTSPAPPIVALQSTEVASSTPTSILSGKAFLITKSGDLMLARFAQVFVLPGEASGNQQVRSIPK
jgi:hypothetical protein